jgi:hypothetical protein
MKCGASIGADRAGQDGYATQFVIDVQHRKQLAGIDVVAVHEHDGGWLHLPDPGICSFDRLHDNDVVVVVVNEQPVEQFRPKRIVADGDYAAR